MNFKGFDLAFNFSYSIGGKVLDEGYRNLMGSPTSTSPGYNFHKDVLKAWSEDNTSSNIPRLQFGDDYSNSTSDRFLTNGSWLSLNNINLGYTFPKVWSSKLGFSKMRVYASADNVCLGPSARVLILEPVLQALQVQKTIRSHVPSRQV